MAVSMHRHSASVSAARTATRFEAFAELARSLAEASTSMDDAINGVARVARDLVGDQAAVLLANQDGCFTVAAIDGPPEVRGWQGQQLPRTAFAARVVEMQRTFRWRRGQSWDCVEADGRIRIGTGERVEAVLSAPLCVRGRTIGTLSVARPSGPPYTDEDQRFLEELASLGALAIDNGRLMTEFDLMAHRLRVMFERCPPLVVTDDDGRCVMANPAATSLLGCDLAFLLGRTLADIVPAPFKAAGDPAPHRRADGSVAFIEYRPFSLADPALRVHRLIDRTHRVAAAQEEIRLLSRLADAEDGERRRVAHDIHDHLGQLLTAAALHVKLLEDSTDGTAEAVAKVRELIDHASIAARRLAWTMRPPEVGGGPLDRAFVALADGMGLVATVDVWPPEVFDQIPPEAAAACYRIVQEALANAARHANAQRVSILAQVQDRELVLEVTDDGCGFTPAKAETGHLGQLIMHERARLIGGKLVVSSYPGAGTIVRLRVPVPGA